MKPSFTELRERLHVEKKVTQEDDFGGIQESWEEHPPLWAKVDFASSKDITSHSLRGILGGKLALCKSLYRVTLRQDRTLPEFLRFKRHNKTLQVISSPIQESLLSDYMVLFAVEL